MICLAVLLIALAASAALYLLCLRPNNGRQGRMKPFEETYIAHRGLFNNNDIPENSMAAFAKAVEAGYGIELDVQLTADDRLVVFHDETLARMCGDPRTLNELSHAELCRLSLLDTAEKVPLFRDVLELVNGSVPLIVEIKPEGRCIQTARFADELLRRYRGVYCVESFRPSVLLWYKRNSPDVIRGQLSTDYGKDPDGRPWWQRWLLTNLLLNFLTRPDFIAYNHKYKNQFSYTLCRTLYKAVNVAWTIRDQEQLEAARDAFQVFIFDSFLPDQTGGPSR